MKNICKPINFIVLATALFFSGCNFPTGRQDQGTAEAVYTQAAETIVAQLTELAVPQAELTQAATFVPLMTGTPAASPETTTTAIPTATETATPTATNTITPTLALQDPKASLGDPDWRDGFDNEANWSLYEDDYVRFQITDGKLIMETKPSESRDSWLLTWPDPQDYYLEAIAQTETCSGMSRYGVIFRTDADEGYLFGFTCDGQYSLRMWDGEQFTALIDWTYSPYILAGEGQINRMGLSVEGSEYSLYANGYYLDQVQDSTYGEGSFGLFVGSRDGEAFVVTVDEIAYWILP